MDPSVLVLPETLCLLMVLSVCGCLLLGFPVAFTLAGVSMLFAYIGTFFGVFDLSFLTAFPQRIFAVMTREVLVAVPLFVFMGVMLERSKVAEELLDNMARAFGSVPGGLAFSVSIVGMLLAASTGIVGATVVTMGLLSLPTMLRRGYDKGFACGSIAASGTLGQIIPPSIVLVLLGDQLSAAYQKAQFDMKIFAPDTVSVNDLFAGALLPGLMLVGLYLLYQGIYAVVRPEGTPAVPRDKLAQEGSGSLWPDLVTSLFAPLILIIAVLGSILAGLASPSEAAGVGAIGSLMLAGHRLGRRLGRRPDGSSDGHRDGCKDARHRRTIMTGFFALIALLALGSFFDLRIQRSRIGAMDWAMISLAILLAAVLARGVFAAVRSTYSACDKTDHAGTTGRVSVLEDVGRQTLNITTMVFVILIGASMFSLVFRGYQGDVYIERFLSDLGGGTMGAVLLVMAVMFVLGFFLDFLEIIFIVVPIVAPVLLQMDFGGEPMSPVWLGVMMGINLQASFLTPPFGFALFYLRGVAPNTVRTMDIYRGVLPFVAIQILALFLLWTFPAIATWLPNRIYGG